VPARKDGHLPEHPACPHCGSEDTELMSAFGTVLANAQYRCRACASPFEFMKWLEENGDTDGDA
jgi:ring-1,2-phenylacetyl-CoA epoxidase subunit PaaD